MNKFRISKKKIIWIIICVLSFVIALLICWRREAIAGKQLSQRMARRWSVEGDVAQVSCFFSKDASITRRSLQEFEHKLDLVLQEASIELSSENPGARLWTDAYSIPGRLSVSSERGTVFLRALGVGGDFFQFHPQELRYGNYFSDRDINKDYVVIDEETAWQLFGGINVAGKTVEINGKTHMISGVIKRPKGKKETAAGLSESIIYVSPETMENYAHETIVTHYEIVMPNPVKSYAMNTVKENLFVSESEVEYVSNTDRFSIPASLKIFSEFGYRSMRGNAVAYPYWENLARQCEDVLAFLTAFMILFCAVPSAVIIIWLIWRWRHKKWTFKSVFNQCVEILGRWIRKLLQKKNVKGKELIRITFDEEEEEEENEEK